MRWSEYTVRQRVMAQLALQGMSKAELSKRSGLHPTALSPTLNRLDDILNAQTRVETVARIARALGVTLVWLLSGEGYMTPQEYEKAGASVSLEAPANLPFILLDSSRAPRKKKERRVKLPSQPRGPKVAPAASKKSRGA